MCFEKLETNVLSAIYSVFIWAGVRHLFIPYLLIDEIATKHPQEKILGPRNTHEKKFRPKKYHKKNVSTHDIPWRKNFGPRRYPWEKNLDSQNTHDKKHFGPMKYPREKNLDPRRYGGTMARVPQDPRWHETHRI